MMRSKVKAKEVKDARRDFVAPQFITIGRKRAGHHDQVDDDDDHEKDDDGDVSQRSGVIVGNRQVEHRAFNYGKSIFAIKVMTLCQ